MGVGYSLTGILACFMGKISMQRITVIVRVLKHAATCIIHNFFHKRLFRSRNKYKSTGLWQHNSGLLHQTIFRYNLLEIDARALGISGHNKHRPSKPPKAKCMDQMFLNSLPIGSLLLKKF